jgi:hypothetical protein
MQFDFVEPQRQQTGVGLNGVHQQVDCLAVGLQVL